METYPEQGNGGPGELVNTAGASEITGIEEGTLVQWRRRETGPPYLRLGPKIVRYRRSDLERFIENSYVVPAKSGLAS